MLTWKTLLIVACFGCMKSNQQKGTGVCHRLQLNKLFLMKDVVEEKLKSRLKHVANDENLSLQEKSHRKKIINILHREINDSVVTIHNAVNSLGQLLHGDHNSLKHLKEISKQHLAQLQASMLITEEDYNALVDEEKTELTAKKQLAKQNSTSKNILKQFFNDVLGDISAAADKLETELDDDAFEAEIHSENKNYRVETVVKVSGEESAGNGMFIQS